MASSLLFVTKYLSIYEYGITGILIPETCRGQHAPGWLSQIMALLRCGHYELSCGAIPHLLIRREAQNAVQGNPIPRAKASSMWCFAAALSPERTASSARVYSPYPHDAPRFIGSRICAKVANYAASPSASIVRPRWSNANSTRMLSLP